jgi:tRNA nucleotidyltransferase/poly(A) polymerase
MVSKEVITMNLHPLYKQLLKKIQPYGETFIIGGFLRDNLCGIKPRDVDIATCASIETIKKMFPQFHATEKGLEFGVARIKYKQKEYEVSFYENKEKFEDSLRKRDLTINTFYHDGETLFDPFSAKEDIKLKRLAAPKGSLPFYSEKPQQFLRVIRFQSTLGFELDEELFHFISQNTSLLKKNTENRIQQEGYKILLGRYPFLSIKTLTKLDFIPKINVKNPMLEMNTSSSNIDIAIGVLVAEIGIESTLSLLHFFRISKKHQEKAMQLSPFLTEEKQPTKPQTLNELIRIKKIQFQEEPERFQSFMKQFRKK